MKRWIIGAVYFLAPLMAATQIEAASLTVGKGDVLVRQGNGFKAASGTLELKAGDSVLVKPNGDATISFSEGCTVSLKAGTVFVISNTNPCAQHSAGAGASGATETPAVTLASTVDVVPYVVGAALVGGVIALATSGGGSSGSSGTSSAPSGASTAAGGGAGAGNGGGAGAGNGGGTGAGGGGVGTPNPCDPASP